MMRPRERWAWALIGFVMFVPLLVARWLEPSPTGMGTHQQLGLPPCTFLTWLQLPCPACGMTTAWAYVTRGDWGAAWQANPGGFLLAWMAALSSLWFFGGAIRGRSFAWPSVGLALVVWVTVLLFILVCWFGRCWNVVLSR